MAISSVFFKIFEM